MKNILVLSPRFPWPLIGGDKVKLYYLLKHLTLDNNVTLITFAHKDLPTPERLRAITDLGVTVEVIPLNPITAGIACIRTLWSDLPLEIAFYTRPDFQKKVDGVLSSGNFDVCLAFFMRTAEYVRFKKDIRKVLIAEDCRVVYQRRASDAAKNVMQRMVRLWETMKLRTYERDVVNDFEVTTLVSDFDLRAMQRSNPDARYAIVTNGVNLEVFSFNQEQQSRTNVVFNGKLDVQANHVMALDCIQNIMPIVARELPSTTLHIVGSNPLPSLRKAVTKHIQLHSDVSDVAVYLQQAAVFVHPHRGGSGIQNKLLEAMACGCVVVTTPSGIQGINAIHNVHCLIGTTDEEIALLVVKALKEPVLRERLAQAAHSLMQAEHQWHHIAQQLRTVIAQPSKNSTTVAHESTIS